MQDDDDNDDDGGRWGISMVIMVLDAIEYSFNRQRIQVNWGHSSRGLIIFTYTFNIAKKKYLMLNIISMTLEAGR